MLLESQGPIRFSKIDITDSADIVALVTAKKIRVLAYTLVATTGVTVKWQTGATTDLSGAMAIATNGILSAPFSPCGVFETAAGAKLNIVLGAAQVVTGHLVYQEV